MHGLLDSWVVSEALNATRCGSDNQRWCWGLVTLVGKLSQGDLKHIQNIYPHLWRSFSGSIDR